MQAIVSASAGLAGLIEGDEAWLVGAGEDGFRSASVDSVRQVLAVYSDAIHLSDTSKSDVLDILNRESTRDTALLLALTVLDESTGRETRDQALPYLEEYLAEDHVRSFLNGVLYSKPLPQNTISQLPSEYSKAFSDSHAFFSALLNSQSRIASVFEQIESAIMRHQLTDEDYETIIGVISSLGVVESFCNPDSVRTDQDKLRFDCLEKLSNIQSGRQLISELFAKFSSDREESVDSGVRISAPRGDEARGEPRHKDRRQPARQVLEQAQQEIGKVESLLGAGKVDRAKQLAQNLIDNQLARDDHPYAAMTLCNLSESAKNVRNYSLQLSWAQQATRIAPEDPRTFAHVGEAYLNLDRLNEATDAFQRCKDTGDEIFGTTGIARVLHRVFRYREALDLVEKLLDEGFVDTSISGLRASLLRDLGRPDEAAEIYKQLMTERAGDSHAMCGYAASHADMGDFDRAVEIYRDACKLYPDEYVPLSGLGFVLVRLGNYRRGLKLLNQSIELNRTNDNIPLSSKLTALRWRGKYDVAKKLSLEMIDKDPLDPIWRLNLLHILIDGGDYETALSEIEKIDELFPENASNERFRALVLRKQGKLTQALKVLDTLRASHPLWLDALVDRGNILKHLGEYQLARRQFKDVFDINPHFRRNNGAYAILKTLLAKRSGEPLGGLVEVIDEDPVTPGDWHSFHTTGLILLANNQLKMARKVLLAGVKNCPIRSIHDDFGVSLAAARTMLGQTGTAQRTVKHSVTELGLIQRTIVLAEIGRKRRARETAEMLDRTRGDTNNVVSLIERRYFSSPSVGDMSRPSIEEVMESQLETMLHAA